MRLRPTLTPRLARRRRLSSAPAPAPARARRAHRLPSARCYPGPARASAGGGLSARRLRKSAAPAPSRGSRRRDHPRRALQAWLHRHPHLRRRGAISAGPAAHQAREICARSVGGPERARVARARFSNKVAMHCGVTCPIPMSTPRKSHDVAPDPGAHVPDPRTKIFLLQAVGASSVSSLRTRTPHGGGGELGVGGSARCAGAYDRTRVRTRVNARAWQGLRRRFKAPCHRLAALNTQNPRVELARDGA